MQCRKWYFCDSFLNNFLNSLYNLNETSKYIQYHWNSTYERNKCELEAHLFAIFLFGILQNCLKFVNWVIWQAGTHKIDMLCDV